MWCETFNRQQLVAAKHALSLAFVQIIYASLHKAAVFIIDIFYYVLRAYDSHILPSDCGGMPSEFILGRIINNLRAFSYSNSSCFFKTSLFQNCFVVNLVAKSTDLVLPNLFITPKQVFPPDKRRWRGKQNNR